MDRTKDMQDRVSSELSSPLSGLLRSRTWKLLLHLCWFMLLLLVEICHSIIKLVDRLKCYLIFGGYILKCISLQQNKLQCLAIVVDPDEAFQVTKILDLLQWLAKIGIKHVCLYDMEGVLKESKKFLAKHWGDLAVTEFKELESNFASRNQKSMTVEWLSYSHGKEGVAKAATYICSNYSKFVSSDSNATKKNVTEADVDEVLKAVGCSGPEPELLLIYGPARCLLGFPAWRMRYTEIVHMGSLTSFSFSALVKVLYDFSKKHQNYGK